MAHNKACEHVTLFGQAESLGMLFFALQQEMTTRQLIAFGDYFCKWAIARR